MEQNKYMLNKRIAHIGAYGANVIQFFLEIAVKLHVFRMKLFNPRDPRAN